ncbi:MAG TPA: VOC family protein [Gammaproteobacteria bacterium]|jgi:glyoxalase/bleomycin resistance protein/dioxygenase superfamily protein
MKTFGFGGRSGQIVQMAYVVRNIRQSIDWWIKDGRAGPFFLLESFTGPEQRYRGGPTEADVSIAMSFAGHMNIELIQPKDNNPSVYKEIIDRRGYGLHHLALAFEDVEAERVKYEGRGYHVAFSTPVPSGGTVYFMGEGADAPAFVELIPATEGTDEMFTRYWKASVDWDGKDPIRPFG